MAILLFSIRNNTTPDGGELTVRACADLLQLRLINFGHVSLDIPAKESSLHQRK
jgi:hypothetical protein